MPPGTPNVGILRESIEKMAKDPAFVSDWARTYGQELAPLRVPPETAERLKNEFVKPARDSRRGVDSAGVAEIIECSLAKP